MIELNVYDPDYPVSANFNSAEFRCRCGCSRALIDERLVEAVQALRDAVGEPLSPTCGYRCPAHNKKVPGSAWNSRHMKGTAVDVAATISFPGIEGKFTSAADHLAKVAESLRHDDGNGARVFKRIGIYPDRYFVHLAIEGWGFRTWRKFKTRN